MPPSKPEREVTRLTIIIDRELHTQFKMAAAAQRQQMTEVLIDFIRDYVRRSGAALTRERRR